jgi:adenosylhomocysteine nucleosidase
MSHIGLIAAMESELAPLVKGWRTESLRVGGRTFQCFEYEQVVAAACGIGSYNAESGARALIGKYRVEVLVSCGLAGALSGHLKVGSIVFPERVIDSATGAEYLCEPRSHVPARGALVTANDVASEDTKSALAEKFQASVVDMEAAGVARVAHEKGLIFRCVKAISDERGFPMPPVGRFVCGGEFQALAFLRWLAVRPRCWGPTVALARNSGRARRALCDWLALDLRTQFQTAELLH